MTRDGARPARRFRIAARRERFLPDERVSYRIPVVPNARRVAAGHRLRLVIASADETDKTPTVLGFTHVVVREASRNTIFSASRLWLPLLPAGSADRM